MSQRQVKKITRLARACARLGDSEEVRRAGMLADFNATPPSKRAAYMRAAVAIVDRSYHARGADEQLKFRRYIRLGA